MRFRSTILFCFSLLALIHECLAQQQPNQANPAVITGSSPGGVGYVDYSSDANGISAHIGRWDTPYPFGNNGPRAPGLEPNGASSFYIDVDVNDGGLASFSYVYKTWDGGAYDWYDIYMETPTGTQTLVGHLGQPGYGYGTFFYSPEIALSVNLDPWKNMHVRFVFSIQQDGWGDQSQGEVVGFGVRSCTVPPITPLTDASALSFEGGQTIDTEHLSGPMQTALSCVQAATADVNGSVRLASAYRPPEYQAHLRAIWDKWNLLRDMRQPECNNLRNLVQAEFNRHGLLLTQRPASADGPHTQGLAVDMSSTLPLNQFLTVANQCQLYRRIPVADPVHYEHR